MSEIFKETQNTEGVPLLSYKNFKFIKSRCNIGGEIFWRCVNRKCRSYMTTEGQPGKRFIVDSDLNHNHDPNDEKVKPLEPQLISVPSKRKHDEVAEPRKILAARIEPVFCSSSMPKEKCGILKSWSFTRRKVETSDSCSLTSSDGSRIDIGGIPKSDPPFPGTYLQFTGPKDQQSGKLAHPDSEESEVKESKSGAGTSTTSTKFRDEYEVAGWMYGNQLRSLDPQQRFITEKLVADIVFKARLKILKITSRVE